MTEDEAWAFLGSAVARPAIVATTRADGRPHAVPVWYAVDGHQILFTTGAETVKGRALRRDPHLALCVDDDRPPFSFVAVEGVVEISEDVTEVRRWATVVGGRYMGADQAERFGLRNGVPGELLVRVRPSRLTAFRDLAD
jgi:PPOX class probable F420-dependent enzyme